MNLEAERAVLGALLKKPELMDECYLTADDFSEEEGNGLVLGVLKFAYEKFSNESNPFDPVLLAGHWGAKLQKIGGISRLMVLRDSVPSVAEFEHYQGIVRREHIQRLTRQAFREATESGEQISLPDTLEKLEKIAQMQTEAVTTGPVKMSELLQNHHKVILDRGSKAGITGSHGVSDEFNQMSGGHQNGDLIIIAGRPSIGKTAALVGDSIAGAKGGRAVAIFSAEMPSIDVTERHICYIGNIDSEKLRQGRLTENDWDSYSKALDILDSLQIYIDDTPGMTIEHIHRKVKELKKKFPKLTVYVDYLQIIESEKKFSSTTERVNYISKQLKQIARTCDVPVIAISSVGRKCEDRQDKRPMMSDLRESGNIEFDADVIIFLYRDDYYYPDTILKGVMELIVAKGRKIGTRTLKMVYNRKSGRMINMTKEEKEELEKKVREHERQGDSKR